MDGELLHGGWVKINAGNAAGRCGNIFGQKKVTGSISRQTSTFPEVLFTVNPPLKHQKSPESNSKCFQSHKVLFNLLYHGLTFSSLKSPCFMYLFIRIK